MQNRNITEKVYISIKDKEARYHELKKNRKAISTLLGDFQQKKTFLRIGIKKLLINL